MPAICDEVHIYMHLQVGASALQFRGLFYLPGFYVLKHCLVCLLHDSCSCIMSSRNNVRVRNAAVRGRRDIAHHA